MDSCSHDRTPSPVPRDLQGVRSTVVLWGEGLGWVSLISVPGIERDTLWAGGEGCV